MPAAPPSNATTPLVTLANDRCAAPRRANGDLRAHPAVRAPATVGDVATQHSTSTHATARSALCSNTRGAPKGDFHRTSIAYVSMLADILLHCGRRIHGRLRLAPRRWSQRATVCTTLLRAERSGSIPQASVGRASWTAPQIKASRPSCHEIRAATPPMVTVAIADPHTDDLESLCRRAKPGEPPRMAARLVLRPAERCGQASIPQAQSKNSR